MLRLISSTAVSSTVVPNALRAILTSTNIISPAQNSVSSFNIPNRNPNYFPHKFSTNASQKLSADRLLLKAVRSEIKSKRSSLNQSMPEPPSDFPFTIEDNPSKNTLEMRRVISDEEILVSVAMPKFIPEDDMDDMDESNIHCCECGRPASVVLYVSVTKKSGKILDFGLYLAAGEMDVGLMSIIEPQSDGTKTVFGPHDVDDVESELKDALKEYLEKRGIRKCDAMFMYKYMVKKSKRLRLIALEKLKKVVEEDDFTIV